MDFDRLPVEINRGTLSRWRELNGTADEFTTYQIEIGNQQSHHDDTRCSIRQTDQTVNNRAQKVAPITII